MVKQCTQTSSLPFLHDHASLSFIPPAIFTFPTLAKLYEDTNTPPPTPFLEDNFIPNKYSLAPSTLNKSILNCDGLLFYHVALLILLCVMTRNVAGQCDMNMF